MFGLISHQGKCSVYACVYHTVLLLYVQNRLTFKIYSFILYKLIMTCVNMIFSFLIAIFDLLFPHFLSLLVVLQLITSTRPYTWDPSFYHLGAVRTNRTATPATCLFITHSAARGSNWKSRDSRQMPVAMSIVL